MDELVKRWWESGRDSFLKQDYPRALSLFTKILNANYQFADVFNMLGVINHQMGKFASAIEAFEKALKINPHYTEAALNLMVLYNDLGQFKQSKRIKQQILKKVPKQRETIDPFIRAKLANKHADVADIYKGIGLYERAAQEFKKAIELGPKFLDLKTKLAVCLREDHRPQEAIGMLLEVLNEKPNYAEARVQLGLCYYTNGERRRAIDTWQEALKIFPNHRLAQIYLRLAQHDRQSSLAKAERQASKLAAKPAAKVAAKSQPRQKQKTTKLKPQKVSPKKKAARKKAG